MLWPLILALESFHTLSDFTNLLPHRNILVYVTSSKDCKGCKTIERPFKSVVRQLEGQSDAMAYGIIDVHKVPAFASRLKLSSVPQILLFTQQDTPRFSDAHYYTFEMSHFGEEKLTKFVTRYGHIDFSKTKTLSKTELFKAMAILSTVLLLGSAMWPRLKVVVGHPMPWTITFVALVLLSTSGYLFVQMRAMPWHGRNRDGSIQTVQPGFQSQFGVEAQWIGSLCPQYSYRRPSQWNVCHHDATRQFPHPETGALRLSRSPIRMLCPPHQHLFRKAAGLSRLLSKTCMVINTSSI